MYCFIINIHDAGFAGYKHYLMYLNAFLRLEFHFRIIKYTISVTDILKLQLYTFNCSAIDVAFHILGDGT